MTTQVKQNNSNKTQLYSSALKTHAMNPIGFEQPINITFSAEGFNAACGDEITISLEVNKNNLIKDVSFESESCAICKASASLLCQTIVGLTSSECEKIKSILQLSLTTDSKENFTVLAQYDLEILSPISQYPSRVNCALLPWQTLIEALTNKNKK